MANENKVIRSRWFLFLECFFYLQNKILKIRLEDIVGSGKDGRVLKDDIVKYLEQMSTNKPIDRKNALFYFKNFKLSEF